MGKKVTRLFNQFAPQHYDLALTIAENKEKFSGQVTINGVKKGRPSKRITLHQKGLQIMTASLIHTDKKGVSIVVPIIRIVKQEKRDEVRLHTESDIYTGSYTITLTFQGSITKNMEGIYPCMFTADETQKKLIATQFESHHAREAFPCIDEPEAKATFILTLTHNSDDIALSNTQVAEQKQSEGRTTTLFHQTPLMSTYLLAFVLGELSYKEAKSKNNVLIRTYATKDQVAHSEFALEVAVKCMDFYEEYYDIPFPLEKCDFVALPDFASGAMENWGLITFREQTLLCDEQNTSLSTKQYVALVVAHELTHQWFGNLVTMQWWTDLWLNEGFASWMEYLAVDHFFPEWQLWSQFVVDEQQLALKLDSLEHTHPIEVAINHPDEIRTIFDAISYQKGASVIHMLHDYLEPEPFKDGLRHYLKKYSYKNTHTVDLWQALEEITKKPVREFMHSWTSQSGFPLVTVAKKNTHIEISQQRFVSNPTSLERNAKTLWPIPLLTKDIKETTVTKITSNGTIQKNSNHLLLNSGLTGFYRVDYSHELQIEQTKALSQGEIAPVDRMGLLADSIEVTKAGYQPVTEYLDLLQYYNNEDSLAAWEIIASSIGVIRSTLSASDRDDKLRDTMRPFVRKLVSVQLARLGWERKQGENHLDTLLRPIIIGMAAGADDEPTVAHALKLYREKIDGKNHVDPDLRGIIYSVAVRKIPKQAFDDLLQLYKQTTSSDEKLSITAALTSFEGVAFHEKVLNLITSDTVRLQDVSYWIAYSFMNRHGRKLTWQWLQHNWDWLRKNLGGDLSFSRMPVYVARAFADDRFLDEYQQFFGKNMEPLLERSFNQGLEIAQTATAWRQRDSEAALKWFLAQQSV